METSNIESSTFCFYSRLTLGNINDRIWNYRSVIIVIMKHSKLLTALFVSMFLLLSVAPASAQRNNRRRTTTSSQSSSYANLNQMLKTYKFKVYTPPSESGTAWLIFFPESNTRGHVSIRDGRGEEDSRFDYTIVSPTEIHFGSAIFNVYDNYIGVTFSNGETRSCTKALRR